ncbi:MAG: diphosphomevalonate decarboxylase [Chloroflexota bacterium]|nr:diphosphomevalonate decarboxylase [Chloroflexota bacterium]
MSMKATAIAHPNIAFIKYWGLKDKVKRIPANDSMSMNIGCLSTRTTVEYDLTLEGDTLTLNDQKVTGPALQRVAAFLDRIRQKTGSIHFAHVRSENNFPHGAGLASSASAFAALALAGTAALGLNLSEKELSSLARFGSGSACRSIPGGFVEWRTDLQTRESFASSFAPADHWKLVDLIAILSEEHKSVGSEAGMASAASSPFQEARVLDAPRRLDLCRRAILNRDFNALAKVTELDSNMMHAVMMTSNPPLFYWHPASLAIIKAVTEWQKQDIPVTYTLDAGPNIHVICPQESMGEVLSRLRQFPMVINILKGIPAGSARLLDDNSSK